MSWSAQHMKSRTQMDIDSAKEHLYNEVRDQVGGILAQETVQGAPDFNAMEFQKVRSIGLFDAEFAIKGTDIIFHFWPYDYHAAVREKRPEPPFPKEFHSALKLAMSEAFGSERVELTDDRDVGAFFVKAHGFAKNQFHHKLAVNACQTLHKALGGEG